jgi:hypothetical protein
VGVPKVEAIRVSMVEVGAVFGFAERHVLGINIYIDPEKFSAFLSRVA